MTGVSGSGSDSFSHELGQHGVHEMVITGRYVTHLVTVIGLGAGQQTGSGAGQTTGCGAGQQTGSGAGQMTGCGAGQQIGCGAGQLTRRGQQSSSP